MNLTEHQYEIAVHWTGNRGPGTAGYRDYGRDHVISAAGLPPLLGSADPTFHGDRDRWNPEQLLLTALAQCHMLSYLHVAVSAGIVVTGYDDDALGTLRLNRDGSGEFTAVILRPRVSIAGSGRSEDRPRDNAAAAELARSLHAAAAQKCFIARSVNFPVRHEPVISIDAG